MAINGRIIAYLFKRNHVITKKFLGVGEQGIGRRHPALRGETNDRLTAVRDHQMQAGFAFARMAQTKGAQRLNPFRKASAAGHARKPEGPAAEGAVQQAGYNAQETATATKTQSTFKFRSPPTANAGLIEPTSP